MSESASQNGAPQKRARTRKSTAKKASAPEPAPPKAAASTNEAGPVRLTGIDRRAMIATAAYYRAERRGFQSGHELEDWLDAEADIEDLLRAQLAGSGRNSGTA